LLADAFRRVGLALGDELVDAFAYLNEVSQGATMRNSVALATGRTWESAQEI
jgi:hypothetical protein